MASLFDEPVPTRRFSRMEYDRLVDLGMFDGERLELLDGLLVVREPQQSPHAATVTQVAQAPDVAMVPGVPRDYLAGHPVRPVLIVEVADSSLRLDRRQKSRLYVRAGLAEYWIANMVDHVVEVYREPGREADQRDGWVYRSIAVWHPPATVTPLAAPHAHVAVADLLP